MRAPTAARFIWHDTDVQWDTADKAAKNLTISSGGARRDASLEPIIARVKQELIALAHEHANRVVKYSEDEARDEHGRWASGSADDAALAISSWVLQGSDAFRAAAASGFHGQDGEDAKAIAAAVANGDKAPALFRGVAMTEDEAVELAGTPVGQTLGMNLSSWSTERSTAIGYTQMGHGEQQVLFELAPGATGLNLDTPDLRSIYEEMGSQEAHEWVTDGHMMVTSLEEQGARLVVGLAQQAPFTQPEQFRATKAARISKVDFFTEDGVVHPIRGSEGYDDSLAPGGGPAPDAEPSIGPKSYLSKAKIAAVAKFINSGSAKFYGAGGKITANASWEERSQARDGIWAMQQDGLRSVGANFARMAGEGYTRTNIAYTGDGHTAGMHGYNASQFPVNERLQWGGDETYGHGIIGATGIVSGAGSALVGAYLRDVAANNAAPVIWPVSEARPFWARMGFAPASPGGSDWGISAADTKAIVAKLR